MSVTLLQLNRLSVRFSLENGESLTAVDGIDLAIREGEAVGIIGESGCGKTVTALAALGLLEGTGANVQGEIRWQERDLTKASESEWRAIRGNVASMVFQNAHASLNPARTIGHHFEAVLRLRRGLERQAALTETERLLTAVHLVDVDRVMRAYAHECSGGMAQRIALALALASKPKLLIADEPTSGLDATVAVQIVNLLRELRSEFRLSLLLISHDLGSVAGLCDRTAVMYVGKIVESGMLPEVFEEPLHPYTQGLLAANAVRAGRRTEESTVVKGEPPRAVRIPRGCAFHPRCPKEFERCVVDVPLLEPKRDSRGRLAACHLFERQGEDDPP